MSLEDKQEIKRAKLDPNVDNNSNIDSFLWKEGSCLNGWHAYCLVSSLSKKLSYKKIQINVNLSECVNF